MTTTVAIANRKGGVGKTTTAVNAADVLTRFHLPEGRVLLIDLDTQRNASLCCGTRLDAGFPSPAYRVLVEGAALSDLAVRTRFGFDLLASHSDLDEAASEIRGAFTGRGQYVLREAIAEAGDRWDVILLDTPPNIGDVTTAALVAADYVVIPLPMQRLPYEGMLEVLGVIESVRAEHNPALKLGGVFATMLDDTTRLHAVIRGQAEDMVGEHLLSLRVRRNNALAEAQEVGVPVTEYKPECNGALDYRELVSQLVSRGVMPCDRT